MVLVLVFYSDRLTSRIIGGISILRRVLRSGLFVVVNASYLIFEIYFLVNLFHYGVLGGGKIMGNFSGEI